MEKEPRQYTYRNEEEQLEAASAFAKAKETTKENVEKAVPLGELIWDTNMAHVRYIKKEDELLYHVFRGPNVPEKFWGSGEFGLCLLLSSEEIWDRDEPKVEYVSEVCRQEVYEDDPRNPPKFPPHFYSSYLVSVPNIDLMLLLPKNKIVSMCELFESNLKEAVGKWKNGGS